MRSLKLSSGWVLIKSDCVLKKGGDLDRHTQRNNHVKTQKKDAVSTPRLETSEETNLAHTWIWEF